MPSESPLVLLYIPVPSAEVGKRLARMAMAEGLAACGNLLGPMTSWFEWEGEFREEREWALLLKTGPERAAALSERVASAHPYDCPCVLRLAAEADAAFARWVGEQTA